MSFANAGNFKYTLCKRRTEMRQNSNRRAYLLIAAIAIGIALLLLLLPHANAGHAPVYLILLPIVFIGLLPFTQWLSRAIHAMRAQTRGTRTARFFPKTTTPLAQLEQNPSRCTRKESAR
jgi:hypothetical protein